MVMGNYKNLHAFNFAIPLKSRKFNTRAIYVFYSNDTKASIPWAVRHSWRENAYSRPLLSAGDLDP